MKFACLLLTVILVPYTLMAQNEIPNAGFESWANGDPVGWVTSNNPGAFITNVTQSSDAHSGSSSARFEVVEVSGFPYPALLLSGNLTFGFSVTERYTYVTGFYKLDVQPGDMAAIEVFMYLNSGSPEQELIGEGYGEDNVSTVDWQGVDIQIGYYKEGIPDGCHIIISIDNESVTGGVAWIDDLMLIVDEPHGCCVGLRGNANNHPSDDVNISDITFLTSYLFGIPSGPEPACDEEANANGNPGEDVNISDVTYLTSYLFGIPSGPAPGPCP